MGAGLGVAVVKWDAIYWMESNRNCQILAKLLYRLYYRYIYKVTIESGFHTLNKAFIAIPS